MNQRILTGVTNFYDYRVNNAAYPAHTPSNFAQYVRPDDPRVDKPKAPIERISPALLIATAVMVGYVLYKVRPFSQ